MYIIKKQTRKKGRQPGSHNRASASPKWEVRRAGERKGIEACGPSGRAASRGTLPDRPQQRGDKERPPKAWAPRQAPHLGLLGWSSPRACRAGLSFRGFPFIYTSPPFSSSRRSLARVRSPRRGLFLPPLGLLFFYPPPPSCSEFSSFAELIVLKFIAFSFWIVASVMIGKYIFSFFKDFSLIVPRGFCGSFRVFGFFAFSMSKGNQTSGLTMWNV